MRIALTTLCAALMAACVDQPVPPATDHTRPAQLDVETALSLAAMPLACLDRPHAPPPDRPGYLDERTITRRLDYEHTRAFYGCWDWHSAVNSTWALVRILEAFPDLSIGPLIREKLRQHLTQAALQGELAFFEETPSFERPYGYAWLMSLHLELLQWDDDDARQWAERIAPLTKLFSDRMLTYLDAMEYPSRVGTHGNTAFAFTMMTDFARRAGYAELERRIEEKARQFYLNDRMCPTAYEPSGADFLSPCLEEAKLMSRFLEPEVYATWLGTFLPPTDSDEFRPLTQSARLTADSSQLEATDLRGAQSHLIGLAFIRAEALLAIAKALPPDDARVAEYRTIANAQGQAGFDAMFDADYEGSHWIGTFALRYLLAE